ncbi:MAG: hypothetical protein WDO19_09455 [Bacteroidota bacterium]
MSQAEEFVDQGESIKKLYQENISDKISNIDEAYKNELDSAKEPHNKAKIKGRIAEEKENVLRSYSKDRIAEIDTLFKKINENGLPIGWNQKNWDDTRNDWLMSIVGWFLAAIAISMGAPFWFDLLIKLVNIRRAGIKPKDED